MNIFLYSYFRHGGAPDQVIELLSDNYMAIAQTATLMADWLISTGVEPSDVVNMIVQHLQTLIEKHFEPKKADSIFEAGGVSYDLFYLGKSLHINLGSIMVN
jgi:negative elongation factor C/D